MPSHSQEIDDLERQMHRVRTSLGVEVHDLVENARAITDWRRYWRSNPWAWSGAAALLGYAVVPHRRKAQVAQADAQALAELAQAEVARAQHNAASAAGVPPPRRRGIMSDLAGIALGFVVQRGLQMAGQQLEGYLNSRAGSRPWAGPEPGRDGAPVRHEQEKS